MVTIVSLALMAYVLLFFEVFFSSGILASLSIVLMAGAVWVGYAQFGPYLGTFIFAVVALLAWLTVVVELQIISRTGLGKKLFLSQKISSQSNSTEEIKALVGKAGETQTPMNLSGKVSIDGQTYEAQSLYEPLSTGVKVVVTDVGPNGLKVKRAE